MSAPSSVLVRVRWSDSAGAFTAQTMVPVKERWEASCTYSAEVAASTAAAKHFAAARGSHAPSAANRDSVTFVHACKPGTSITQVSKEWAAFEFALKGSETQTELFRQGGHEP